MTNYDKIMSEMTIEKMAMMLCYWRVPFAKLDESVQAEIERLKCEVEHE